MSRVIQPVYTELTINDRQDLHEWYRIYALCFPDPNEREEEAQFHNILHMNDDARLQAEIGPWQEAIFAIRDGATGRIIGGLNFGITYHSPKRAAKASVTRGFAATVQVPFLFADPAFRDRAHDATLVLKPPAVLRTIRDWIDSKLMEFGASAPDKDILLFFEANDPIKMSPLERRRDKANAQIDPWVRYATWFQFAKPLDFAYVQPPLQQGKQPVTYLDLFCLRVGPGGSRKLQRPPKPIPPLLLRDHLHAFFSASVLKGSDANEDVSYLKQRNHLEGCAKSGMLVGFIAAESNKIKRIQARARENENIITNAGRAWEILPARMTDRASVSDRLKNIVPLLREKKHFIANWKTSIYRLAYFLNDRVEAFEPTRRFIDFAIALVGLAATVIWLLHLATSMDWFDEISIPSLIITALAGILRFAIWRRRRHLGIPFWTLWRDIDSKFSHGIGEDAKTSAHAWLLEKLEKELSLNFGPLFDESTDAEEKNKALDRIFAYGELFYSEEALGRGLSGGAPGSLSRLRLALRDFVQGLWAASYDQITCFGIVLPMMKPNPDAVLDAKTIETDKELCALLQSSETQSNLGRDTNFLVHSCFVDIPPSRWAASEAEIIETRILLLALIHLAYFLENIDDNGNLKDGLKQTCHIYWWRPGLALSKLLKNIYGFVPYTAQQDAGGEGARSGTDYLGMWRLTIDDAMLDGKQPHDLCAQRFVSLLHRLLMQRNNLLPANPATHT
ncbi:MAG TPA: hypothetical protein VGH23_21910 [Rhizomicrobium sp.]|jgi:hypothetical protein